MDGMLQLNFHSFTEKKSMVESNEMADKSKRKRGGSKKGRKWVTHKVRKLDAEIVEVLLGNPTGITVAAIAAKLKRPESTIARRMKDPEVAEAMKEYLFEFVDSRLIHHAVNVISHAIMVKKDVGTAKWLMENVKFFPDDSDQEKEGYEATQERLLERMADILISKSKQGGEEIDGLDPDTFVTYTPQPPNIEN